jgi:ribosomal protein S18 acetylase RimI-like enzyme
MRIRPYDSRDRAPIRDILTGSGTFTDEEVDLAIEVIGEAQAFPERDEYDVLCAEDTDGRLVGYICFGPIPITDRCFDLYWICVDPGTSRKGIGGLLLSAMEDALAKKRARHVYVDTSSLPSYDRARSFYEKHGYRPVSVFPDFYCDGDDKIVYLKKMS